MIEFKNVSKQFKNNQVLKNVSLTINDGDLTVIIGASGCGKTTMLKMINRLIAPTAGDIFINGENTHKKDPIELRRGIGYVIQQTGLFPHMTVQQNIEIVPKLAKKNAEKIKEKTLSLMEMVGMDPTIYLDRYPTELSGGQQQRIGVARAFATDPDIILMDEPFSALDPITRSQLQDELANLQAKLRKTIVFVTHDMDEAVKIADRICIMKDGHVLQYDTPEVILKNPIDDFVADFVGKNRIWSSPEFIKAKDIMISEPVCCSEELPALRCIERMRISKVDSLMVTNQQRQLVGIIRAKDLRSTADRSILAGQRMRRDFFFVSPEDNIVDVLEIVDREGSSTIPVVGQDGKLCGLITKSSLVTTMSHQFLDSEGSETA